MADPNQNILSLSIPTDVLTGAGGGLNLNYNFGPNADTIARNAYAFVGQQANTAMAFQQRSIVGTQNFLSAQTMPIINAVANEADGYYNQILGAFSNVTNAQVMIAQQSIQAQRDATAASINASKKSQKGGSLIGAIFGGCYITTAVCARKGLPDDCEILMVARNWRDTYMQETADRRAMVSVYYETAPKYVAGINKLPNHQQLVVWSELERLIIASVRMIESGNNDFALGYYCAAVDFARYASGVANG